MRQILTYWLNHPLASKKLGRTVVLFVWWQTISRLRSIVSVKFATKSRLVVRRGMTGATGNIYCGLHEFQDMGWLLHTLRPEDLFLDIGANVGSYTVLAASEVGAEFHAFEPIPSTFGHLHANIEENKASDNGRLWNNGLGDKHSTLRFTYNLDTVNHVASESENGIDVDVLTLDEITFADKKRLVKIDVEGYEQFVLDGGQAFFKDKQAILGIIIELNGSGKRFGKSDLEIHQQLLSWGYASYAYDPIERRLEPVEVPLNHNTIYITNANLLDVEQRIASAPKRKIHGVIF